jgi:hypothetical protein
MSEESRLGVDFGYISQPLALLALMRVNRAALLFQAGSLFR